MTTMAFTSQQQQKRSTRTSKCSSCLDCGSCCCRKIGLLNGISISHTPPTLLYRYIHLWYLAFCTHCRSLLLLMMIFCNNKNFLLSTQPPQSQHPRAASSVSPNKAIPWTMGWCTRLPLYPPVDSGTAAGSPMWTFKLNFILIDGRFRGVTTLVGWDVVPKHEIFLSSNSVFLFHSALLGRWKINLIEWTIIAEL